MLQEDLQERKGQVPQFTHEITRITNTKKHSVYIRMRPNFTIKIFLTEHELKQTEYNQSFLTVDLTAVYQTNWTAWSRVDRTVRLVTNRLGFPLLLLFIISMM